MFESRCGIECSSCEGKEEVSCSGCINMEGTFWGGTCSVKECVLEKGIDHCGLCEEFPCEMASTMGKDQGYDPEPRLKKCLEWAKES